MNEQKPSTRGMTREKPKTCFIYVRVSTQMQVDKGESIEAQLFELRRQADIDGLRVIEEFVDAGKSGKNVSGRPEFRRMMDAICSGSKVDYVLVFKLSRFGRNAADSLQSLQLLQDFGCELICVKDGIRSDSGAGRLMIQLMSIFAEMERENILTQTMAGREQKAREGKWNGGQAPYGYRLEHDADGRGYLVVDEDEAKAVRLAFSKYASGEMGATAIAAYLNDHGYRRELRGNTKQATFNPNTIRKMLDNEIYVGKIAFGRRRTERIEGRRNEYHMVAQDHYEVYDGLHEALVDEETWGKVRERRATASGKFQKKSRWPRHEHLLTGVLICPVCGKKMIANVRDGKRKKDGTHGKPTFSYVCRHSKKQYGPTCSFTRQYPQAVIDREVLTVIKSVSHSEVFERRIREEIDAASDIDKLAEDLDRTQSVLERNERSRRMLARKMDMLDVADSMYERKYDEMQARLDALYEEAEGLEQARHEAAEAVMQAEAGIVIAKSTSELLDEFERSIGKMTDAEKKALIASLIETVEINADADYRKGDTVVSYVRFKVPINFEHSPDDTTWLCGASQDPKKSWKEAFTLLADGDIDLSQVEKGDILFSRDIDFLRAKEHTVETVSILKRK